MPFRVEMSPLWLKHMYSVFAWTCRPMPAAFRSRLCSTVSARAGVFAKSSVIGVVCVRNCLCGVPSASFLCQLETVVGAENVIREPCSNFGQKCLYWFHTNAKGKTCIHIFSLQIWVKYYWRELDSVRRFRPVNWGCRIRWLHLCRGVRPLH